MNKTLSLIEEDADEEFFTNNEERSGSLPGLGETRKMFPGEIGEDFKQLNESSDH